MLTWFKTKWASHKKQKQINKELKRYRRIQKQCVYCRLWNEHLSYYETMNNLQQMPKPPSFLVRPCSYHATDPDILFYNRMNRK